MQRPLQDLPLPQGQTARRGKPTPFQRKVVVVVVDIVVVGVVDCCGCGC